MTQSLSLTACWALALSLFAAPATWAQDDSVPDPEAIAVRCVDRVTTISDNRVEANEALSARAISAIEDAIEADNANRARFIARKTAKRINRGTRGSLQRMNQTCRRCVNALNRLEEPELADRVQSACDDEKQDVTDSREAALSAIREALAPIQDDDDS